MAGLYWPTDICLAVSCINIYTRTKQDWLLDEASCAQVDTALGDARPGVEQMKQLRYTTRVINEAMRLYPQPPVLIRRALEPDVLGGYPIAKGQDFFISVWNLHRSPELWEEPEAFNPDRFGPLDGSIPNEVGAAAWHPAPARPVKMLVLSGSCQQGTQ